MMNIEIAPAVIGGFLIGLSAVLLLLFSGRIAGISGIFNGLFEPDIRQWPEKIWRALFILGLLAGVFLTHRVLDVPVPELTESNLLYYVAAGLLVGAGTRLGSGCTSGHGVCGMGRMSGRSIAATLVYVAAGMIVVALMKLV